MNDRREEFERRRRAILRRATVYTWGFLGVGLAIAVGGSALVAWLMARTGLPFLATWGVITGIVLLPSLIGLVVRAVRERSRRHGDGPPDEREKEPWPKTEH